MPPPILKTNADNTALAALQTQEKPLLAAQNDSPVTKPSSLLQKYIDTGESVFKDAAGSAMNALSNGGDSFLAAIKAPAVKATEFAQSESSALFKPLVDTARKAADMFGSTETVTKLPGLPYSQLRGSDASAILDKTLSGIASNESGGKKDPYMAINHNTNGTTDYGKYQVNSQTLKELAPKYLGQSVTPAQFIASPALQEKFAKNRADHMLQQGYSDQEVASMWHYGASSIFNANDPYVQKYEEATSSK